MKLYISTDIEGTAGVVDWEQVRSRGAEYEIGRQLLTDEVNAAIDGAVEAGADYVLVNDAHSTMYNMRPGALHHGASYLSGRHKPLYMMEGSTRPSTPCSWLPTTERSAPSGRSFRTLTTRARSGRCG
jgi:D-amino peptidase